MAPVPRRVKEGYCARMRLFSGRVAPIAAEVVRILIAAGDIETESPKEVQADVEAVLRTYLAAERDVNDRTKELLERTGRSMNDFGRVRNQIAETKGIKVGDEMLDYVLDQVVQIFHHSANVEEIFVEDVELRRKMAAVFKKHMALDGEIDAEVRAQLRHVSEGSRTWEVEYARVLEQVKRKKGVS
ncbi:DUF507 family protein [Pendulispora brunnea]|uniref:DUF507 family protein n=1 Tax=Pendulispora brunnea TaxID=2905690 RepID=A0ABZ2JYR5_9BACT